MKAPLDGVALAVAPEPDGSGPPWRRWGAIVGIHLAGVLLWEAVVRIFAIQSFILPAPSRVLATLGNTNLSWLSNTTVTAIEIFGGYALGLVLGILCALLFITSRRLTLLVFPVLVTLNMIPKVALGPLVIVWFSYGIGTNILITFSLCFFPILLTTIRGLNETEPELLDLVRALKGSRWQLFRYIQLPGSLPYVFSGMKVATILAVAGAVVGEFIASDKGLGYLMIQLQASLDTPAVFMAVLLITGLGVLLYLLVLLLERLFITQDARIQ
ncbi:MAG: ABC transporter permease [Polaromonas sp.]|uniref:ABC transporter permease n=1 Tax=Polaromonas sp. TaxID=1869339 RepID=UPI0024880FDF|nr:ABC transporter permease [Polaromonas sp.]MDI1268974.1 ABC transporter permease [Polaromonas sp.]MDO9112769.1 ABC transporter permease [Polaromonas sp.]MDP1887977.1 ABC transporter permease [Polaromonas sp.]MDP2451613.1 ABC transporter permease [Polaromonas sp.]MDP3247497.1 ABC transporter permease [Polaromonas sp.]